METLIGYNNGVASGKSTVTSILTSETTLVTITDSKFLKSSQITAYYSVTLGSATAVNIRYYFSCDNGTTWFQAPIKNTSTGELVDTPSVINSTSPAQSGDRIMIEDRPMSACSGFRITATATGATATLNNLTVITRDN